MRRIEWVLCATLALAGGLAAAQDGDWSAYGRDPGGERFSPLDRITRENVGSLQVAWTFRTGDAYTAQSRAWRPRSKRRRSMSTELSISARPRKRHRPRSCFRPATLGFRREVAARHGVRRFREPRRLDVAAGQRASHLRRDDRRAAHRPRLPHGQACPRLRRSTVSSTYVRDCGSRRWDSPTTRSPPRPRLSATRSSLAPALRTAPRSRIRAAKCAGFDAVTGKLKWTWDPVPQDPSAVGADSWKNHSGARSGGANAWSVIVGGSRPQPGLRANEQSRATTTSAESGSATTCSRTRSSRCARTPGCASGTSRPFTTICGTTTSRRRQSCSTGARTAARSPRWRWHPRPAISSSSIARPGRR